MKWELRKYLTQLIEGKGSPSISDLGEDSRRQLSTILQHIHAVEVANEEDAPHFIEMFDWLHHLARWHPRAQEGLPPVPSQECRNFMAELVGDFEREALNAGRIEEEADV